jgi:hypothetical protein
MGTVRHGAKLLSELFSVNYSLADNCPWLNDLLILFCLTVSEGRAQSGARFLAVDGTLRDCVLFINLTIRDIT